MSKHTYEKPIGFHLIKVKGAVKAGADAYRAVLGHNASWRRFALLLRFFHTPSVPSQVLRDRRSGDKKRSSGKAHGVDSYAFRLELRISSKHSPASEDAWRYGVETGGTEICGTGRALSHPYRRRSSATGALETVSVSTRRRGNAEEQVGTRKSDAVDRFGRD